MLSNQYTLAAACLGPFAYPMPMSKYPDQRNHSFIHQKQKIFKIPKIFKLSNSHIFYISKFHGNQFLSNVQKRISRKKIWFTIETNADKKRLEQRWKIE